MAARLESATKQYGVSVLLSGPMYKILSPAVQGYVRLIDKVTVKGSIVPVELFTFDLEAAKLGVRIRKDNDPSNEKMLRYFRRKKQEKHLANVMSNKIKVSQAFEHDDDIKRCREQYSKEFYRVFSSGIKFYLGGQWGKARKCLTKAGGVVENDGPSKCILAFMHQSHFHCPREWRGFRELVEK